MFFNASKILWALLNPVTVMFILLVIAGWLLWRQPRVGRKVALWVISIVVFLSVFPCGEIALQGLENRYAPPTLPTHVDGIILLGGFIETQQSMAHNQVQMNDSGDRFTAFEMLAAHYPAAQLVFTGGSGDLFDPNTKESDLFIKLWHDTGHSDKNLLLENKSRNTFENAVLSKQLAKPKTNAIWLLVTSASHMPRAVAIFHNIDWPVTAYPCDYQTNGDPLFSPLNMSPLRNWKKLTVAVKEYLGLIVYHWSGRA